MKKFWYKIAFWDAVKDTFALFGPATELMLLLKDAPDKYQFLVTVITFGGYLGSHMIRIWVKDQDGDGNVDMLQP